MGYINKGGQFGNMANKVMEDISKAVNQGDKLQKVLARTNLLAILKDQETLWL